MGTTVNFINIADLSVLQDDFWQRMKVLELQQLQQEYHNY